MGRQRRRENIYDLYSWGMESGRPSCSLINQIHMEEIGTALWPGSIRNKPGVGRAVSWWLSFLCRGWQTQGIYFCKSPNGFRIEDSVMLLWWRTVILIRITHWQMSRNHQNLSNCSTEWMQSFLKWIFNLLLVLLFFHLLQIWVCGFWSLGNGSGDLNI